MQSWRFRGVAGPAAPILAAAGIGLATITALLGDRHKQRDAGLNSLIFDAAYTAPDPLAYNADLFGRSVDYDYKGGIRSGAPVVVVNMNVNAIDQKGVLENADVLASGIQFAIQKGHPVSNTMRESVSGGNAY